MFLLLPAAARAAAAQGAGTAAPATRAPDEFFGFRMGTDGRYATWSDIDRYIRHLAESSPRVRLVSLGKTTEGRDYLAALVSSPAHMARLEEIRQTNLRLSDPRTLEASEAAALVQRQPAVVAIGASIHANEVMATQAASELLFQLATATDSETQAILDALVVIVLPSLNPDGHEMVVDWFMRTRGTPYENAPMPWLYHRYAGHDINRDGFMLNLAESRQLAQFFYTAWHPQVFLTMHQMGAQGPRLFVPPNYDPIDTNYDPMIWRTAGLLGHAMAMQLERDGRSGVVQNAFFDYYWPGYEDSAPLGHNTVCLLIEAASSRLGGPVDLRDRDLLGGGRGFSDHRPRMNYPNPWRGGLWRPRDIVDYELSAVAGLLRGASRYRQDLLENFYGMGRRAVEAGRDGRPFAFVIPPSQQDPYAAAALVNLLADGAVEVQRAIEPFRANGRDYPAGSDIVFMSQPFRAYAKTLLERQQYPARRLLPNLPPERPYDVTGWTLPLQMGVTVDRIEQTFAVPALSRLSRGQIPAGHVAGERRPAFYLFDIRGTGGIIALNALLKAGTPVQWTLVPLQQQGVSFPAGSLILPPTEPVRTLLESLARDLGLPAVGVRGPQPRDTARLSSARIGLYRPWLDNVDEGWTRLLLERFGFAFTSVTDADLRAGGLRARFDVLILPEERPNRILTGNPPGSVPAEYVGGIGREGLASLKTFVNDGGTLVCLDSSCAIPVQTFPLPVKEVLKELPPNVFFCPGSILALRTDLTQPGTFGMAEHSAAFFTMGSAFEPQSGTAVTTSAAAPPAFRPLAWYGTDDLLLSGWLEGHDAIAGKVAAAEAGFGGGRVVLIGFRSQHRAQSYASFRLLFNALYSHPSEARVRR